MVMMLSLIEPKLALAINFSSVLNRYAFMSDSESTCWYVCWLWQTVLNNRTFGRVTAV